MGAICQAGVLEQVLHFFPFFFSFFLCKEQKLNTENRSMSSESAWVLLDLPRFMHTEPLLLPASLATGPDTTGRNYNPLR
jgi:hypothetical protein